MHSQVRVADLASFGADHDEGHVRLLTTASLRGLTELGGGESDGRALDPVRFRANLLLDVAGNGFPEDDWPGRRLCVGPEVVLRISGRSPGA